MKAMVVCILLPLVSLSQENDSSLTSRLSQGKFSGHARTFFMATVNEGALTDYYAWAIGAGIRYESPEIERFKVGVSGFFIYNVASSDLSQPDPLTNIFNRYEIGLFDVTNADNRKDLDRLEELFLQYRIRKSFVRAGKVILNTPFINPQDGRMRPTLEQGITMEINEIKNLKIEGVYLTHISPRSTVNWYSVEESIGVYPSGVSTTGVRSDYSGHVNSNGIYLLGLTYRRKGEFIFWNTFIENISNTVLVQIEPSFGNHRLYGGFQYVRQDAVGEGGNVIENYAYMEQNTHTNIFSSRIGHRIKNFDFNVNGTIIDGNGRYLMPREWGREPFYTFMPRERTEGAGSVKAVSIKITYTSPKMRLRSSLGIGHFDMPDVTNHRLNKYTLPSFSHLNAEIRYDFEGYLEGAAVQFLYAGKLGRGEDYENPKIIINKVNMSNFSLVFNYSFESHHAARKKSERH
jgi:hypothetical protein